MKFVLTEKYTLRERFILTEADDNFAKALSAFGADYEKSAQTLQELREKLSMLTDESTAYTNTQLLNKIEQVNKNVSANALGDIEILKSSVREAIEAAKSWLESVLDKTKKNATVAKEFPQLNNIIDRLGDYTVPGKNASARDLDTDEKNIKAHWKDFYGRIAPLLSVSPTANSKEISELIENLDEIIASETLRDLNSLANAKIKNKALIELIKKLISDYDALKTTAKDLSDKFDSDSTSLNASDFENAIEKEKAVLADIHAVEDGKTMNAAGKLAKKGSRSDTDDWRAELDLAETREEKQRVWLRFYEKTFGKERVSQIRKINADTNAFASECLELGFSTNENPFIYFLQANKDILAVLDQFSYGSLHNAFARGYISSDDLRNKGTLGTSNVIFNRSLYRDHYKDILEYLGLQSEALHYFKSGEFITDTLKNRYRSDIDFITDLFYKPGDTLAVSKKAGNIKNDLKPLLQIRKELEGCFNVSVGAGGQTNAQERLTDSALRALTAKLKGDRNDSIASVLYAYQKMRRPDNVRQLNAILDKYPEIANSNLGVRSAPAIERIGNLIDAYSMKTSDFQPFVDAVAKAAGIKGGN